MPKQVVLRGFMPPLTTGIQRWLVSLGWAPFAGSTKLYGCQIMPEKRLLSIYRFYNYTYSMMITEDVAWELTQKNNMVVSWLHKS